MPVYNPESRWFERAIQSVFSQLYPDWELCIADDHSTLPHVRALLERWKKREPRLRVVYRSETGHIAAATNSALELASHPFVVFMDHDDELSEHALYWVAEELQKYPEAELIYSDEDKIDEKGRHHFKPDWNPDLFHTSNYISHLSVLRRERVCRLGGLRAGYEGSQDYDLLLRVTEDLPGEKIRHIPQVLYHWRKVPGSTAESAAEKGYAFEASRRALVDHFRGQGKKVQVCQGFQVHHRVRYPLPEKAPLVTLIVPTRDRVDLLKPAIESVIEKTRYAPVEILIVDNDSRAPETLAYFDSLRGKGQIRILKYAHPFNYSKMNNWAVAQARGEVIGLLNNDIEVINEGWLSEMVSQALRPEIGAVGAKLLYEDGKLQHAGLILGLYGLVAYSHKGLSAEAPGYASRVQVTQNVSAVTAACLVIRKTLYEEVGGLDEENLGVGFNDVDFCLRLRERGYRNLWTPYARLYHKESATRGPDTTGENRIRFDREKEYFKNKWKTQSRPDPYYNENLTLDAEDFSLANPPRGTLPWRTVEARHTAGPRSRS